MRGHKVLLISFLIITISIFLFINTGCSKILELNNITCKTRILSPPFSYCTSNQYIFVFGEASINGQPAESGDWIGIFAPGVTVNNGCIGACEIDEHPYYVASVYGNDPTSDEKDGADPGDALIFKAWDKSEGEIIDLYPLGLDPPIWSTQNEIINVDLSDTSKQEIPLAKGWNLISFQVAKCFYDKSFPNLSIINPNEVEFIEKESLLEWLINDQESPIRDADNPEKVGDWQRITSYDPQSGASILDKGLPPSINTLHHLALGHGYWINMNKAGVFTIKGRLPSSDTAIYLKTGWNLMGFIPFNVCYSQGSKASEEICPYMSEVEIYRLDEGIFHCPVESLTDTVFESIAGKYRRITSFDTCNGAMVFDTEIPPFLNTLYYIGPKYGYWIKMLEDAKMNFPKGCPGIALPPDPFAIPIDIKDVVPDTLEFSGLYKPEEIQCTPQVPSHNLPLEETQIGNLDSFRNKIQLSPAALELIKDNGFVVIENPINQSEEYITKVYSDLRKREIPIFITTDSLLHLYHIQYDETLRMIEEKEFYQDIWAISTWAFEHFADMYEKTSGELKEEARRNAGFFAVALSLLAPKPEQVCIGDEYHCNNWEAYFKEDDLTTYSFNIPEFIKAEAEEELTLIEAHAGYSTSPLFKYEEDYSQYVPRGHYTRSEKLKNYFKAFMWYGRISFLLKGKLIKSADPEHDAKMQTAQAALIALTFARDDKIDDKTGETVETAEAGETSDAAETAETGETIKEKWDRIYSVTSFYVGTSDDLGPYEYLDAMRSVFGDTVSPKGLSAGEIEQLKAKLAEFQPPKIYGGTGACAIDPPFTPEQADECLEDTKGFRFMGQRFIPDSYMFSNLVGDHTDEYQRTYTDVDQESGQPFTLVISGAGRKIRGFPRGLDVMALLGSKRARDILIELDDSNYIAYDEALGALQKEFAEFTQKQWNKNLYFSWLYSLIPLLEVFPGGYPRFMRTFAWHDKELTTALASWTELRHDTILYAKQSYTMGELSPPPPPPPRVFGYIEPVPEFYKRLIALTQMTTQGLTKLNILDEVSQRRLKNLEDILQRLLDLSIKELQNEELTDDDYDFINDFADELNRIIIEVDDKAKKTTIIADVHTETNTMHVLEEAVGYVKMIVVAYKVPDGRILIGAGPVMSYYEFKQPADSRLTDEKWREILETEPPDDIEWFSNFGI